jgi:hypothetical protein
MLAMVESEEDWDPEEESRPAVPTEKRQIEATNPLPARLQVLYLAEAPVSIGGQDDEDDDDEGYEKLQNASIDVLIDEIVNNKFGFDQIEPGLGDSILWETLHIASWIREDWQVVVDRLVLWGRNIEYRDQFARWKALSWRQRFGTPKPPLPPAVPA